MTVLLRPTLHVDGVPDAVEKVHPQARNLIAQVVRSMRDDISGLAAAMRVEDSRAIPALQIDPPSSRLLQASIEGNLDALLYVADGSILVDDVEPPAAAISYARRLAQLGKPSSALLDAYRRDERHFVGVALSMIRSSGYSGETGLAAAQIMHDVSFTYFAKVTARLSTEYERERERWTARGNTVTDDVLNVLLSGAGSALAAAESAVGYRMQQNHVGVVVWHDRHPDSSKSPEHLEFLVMAIGKAIGAAERPLFIARDMALGWAWIPLGQKNGTLDAIAIEQIRAAAGEEMQVALGTVGHGLAGFRATHAESIHAFAVASVDTGRPSTVTGYGEPGVAAAALLASDLVSTRNLVSRALGGLAADDERSESLRETLLTRIELGGSSTTTAELLEIHRNTVFHRLAEAEKIRGRPLHEDPLDLHLALTACRWLGKAVLLPRIETEQTV